MSKCLSWSLVLAAVALVAAPAASLPRQPGTNDDTWAGERWTNGRIPYVIDKDGDWSKANDCGSDGESFKDDQIDAIHDGLDQLEALTPLDFVEKTEADPPASGQAYILYRHGPNGSSAAIRGMPTDVAMGGRPSQRIETPMATSAVSVVPA